MLERCERWKCHDYAVAFPVSPCVSPYTDAAVCRPLGRNACCEVVELDAFGIVCPLVKLAYQFNCVCGYCVWFWKS